MCDYGVSGSNASTKQAPRSKNGECNSPTLHSNLQLASNRRYDAERGQRSVCDCGADFSLPAKEAAKLRRTFLKRQLKASLAKAKAEVTRLKTELSALAA